MSVDLSILARGIPLDPLPELYELCVFHHRQEASESQCSSRPEETRGAEQGGVRAGRAERPSLLPREVSRDSGT